MGHAAPLPRMPHPLNERLQDLNRRVSAALIGPWSRALALLGAAAGVWLLAGGLQRWHAPLERLANDRAVAASGSPLAYGTAISSLASVTGAGGWRFVVRVDSLSAGDAERLCDTLEAMRRRDRIIWLDLSGTGPACAAGSAEAPADPADRMALRHQMVGARWALVNARDRTVYSGRSVPSAPQLDSLGAFFGVGREGTP
jgi:hypothetical protein